MHKILSPLKQRLLKYLEYKDISKEDFLKYTGISRSNFTGKGLESELGGDKITKILTLYVDISPDWFIRGVGPMLRSQNLDYNVVNEDTETYKTSICQLCKEKDRTIEAMRMANQALQVALNAMQHNKDTDTNNYSKTG